MRRTRSATRGVTLALLGVSLLAPLSAARAQADEAARQRVRVGVELDLLPYVLGGAYGSVWGGQGHWRARAVLTRTTLPSALVPDGFRDHRLDAYTAIVDYFPAQRFRGWWVGAGFEYWKNRVSRDDANAEARWNTPVGTIGGGYVQPVWRGLYVNPWAAGHAALRDRSPVDVGGREYRVRRLTAEASLKVGWIF